MRRPPSSLLFTAGAVLGAVAAATPIFGIASRVDLVTEESD